MTHEDRLRQIHRLFVQLANTKGAEYERTWDRFAQVIQDIPQGLTVQQADRRGLAPHEWEPPHCPSCECGAANQTGER